ncbi:glycosyltransferase [Pseudoduganella namucuonensis]|uniref:Glycosyltransferase involved in cell wall bisynthesis n=1 Tax=Pseudoduganella namucuonensis TaxID=1035707 RepID=A0A1I7M535_9BURK|nr:glycosyltransferase [Pseudoduganella namucuonensis]SFV17023.1 Glycosyltransferase involved in cell wall bisynthesis [Pseudoduganella namucuonensis]
MSHTVSVVIPVYNGAPFIARTIKSVLAQSLRPQEIIVVDDGSIDDTARLLSQFADEIRVVSIPNGGVSNARNVGFAVATGDYIAFLDADDVWYPDKLKVQIGAMRKFPDVGFCCCDYIVFDKSRGEFVNHFSAFDKTDLLSFDEPMTASPYTALLRENFVGTASSVVVRRSTLEHCGLFNVHLRQAEDYDLWLRCAKVTSFLVLSAQLMNKTTHDTNLTNDYLDTLLCHERVLQSLSQDVAVASTGWTRRTREASLAKVRYQIGNLLFEEARVGKAFRYYFSGLRTSLTLENAMQFLYYTSRKTARLLSIGMIRNKESSR